MERSGGWKGEGGEGEARGRWDGSGEGEAGGGGGIAKLCPPFEWKTIDESMHGMQLLV